MSTGLRFTAPEAARKAGRNAEAVRTFRLVSVLATQLRRLSDARMRGDAMTTRQATLITIAKELGRPSLTEVADVMSTSHQNVKQIALPLVRRGFLQLVADTNDGRVRRLVVTAKSDRFWATRDVDDFAAIGGWFAALTRQELTTVNALLGKLSASLGPHETATEVAD